MIEFKNNFRIEYTKGDTYALKLTFKNVTQDLTSAIFSVKENAEDETALIEKTINSGISKLDENFYKNELVYKLQLQANDSQNLQADNLYLYDLKIAVGNVIKTVISGNFIVRHNVTSVERMTTELLEIEVDDEIETDAETTPATHGIEYEQDPVAMAKIGDITQLNTTAKNNLVSAINEVNTKATASAEEITKIEDGTFSVPEATHATSADNATSATNATNATSATNATNATNVQNVDFSANTPAQFGDYIIAKKKVLLNSTAGVQTYTFENVPTKIEIVYGQIHPNNFGQKSVVLEFQNQQTGNYMLAYYVDIYTTVGAVVSKFIYNANTKVLTYTCSSFDTSFNETALTNRYIYKIFEIIE